MNLFSLHSRIDDYTLISNPFDRRLFPCGVGEAQERTRRRTDGRLQVPSLDRSDTLLSLCFFSAQICSSVHRQQLVVALMMHLSQQFSGINAVSGGRSGLRPPCPCAVLDPRIQNPFKWRRVLCKGPSGGLTALGHAHATSRSARCKQGIKRSQGDALILL